MNKRYVHSPKRIYRRPNDDIAWLTPRQMDMLGFFVEFIDKNLYPPTIIDVADEFNIGSKTAVTKVFELAAWAGYMRKKPPGARGWTLSTKGRNAYGMWFVGTDK